MLMRSALSGVLAGLCVATSARAEIIDDFESPSSPAPWTFSNGAEFPGATGSLERSTGQTGNGARLAYDFSGGGAYVAMYRSLASVEPARPIALWLRADPGLRLVFRVTDAEGQSIQFPIRRPFEALAPGGWYRAVVPDRAEPIDHWGGANDGVIHGGVRELGILVQRSELASVAGSIDVDEVALLDAAEFELDPSAPGIALDPAAAVLRGRLGANLHATNDDRLLDLLRDAGLSWVRMDLFWDWVERQEGVYDFGAFDDLVGALDARDMKAILILDYGNPLYGGSPPTTPGAIAAYGNYAEAAARHFAGRGVVFEVWNEPDSPHFWPPEGAAAEYVPLLREGITRVHRGDPAAQVSTGGASWFDFPWFREVLEAGGADGADFVGVHPYRSEVPETAVADFVLLRQMVGSALQQPPPVLSTEWGYTATDLGGDGTAPAARARQAVLAVRQALTNWVLGTPISIWYDARDDCDDGADGQCNFGLVQHDYADKPAIVALRQLTRAAEGRRLTALLSTPETPRMIRLEGESDMLVVAWMSDPGSTRQVSAPEPLSAADAYGEPLALSPAAGRVVFTLDEAGGPVYLRYPSSASPDGGTAGSGPGSGGTAGAGGSSGFAGSVGSAGSAAGGATGAGARSGAAGGASSTSGDSGGCGCRAARGGTGLLPLLLAFVLLLGRRRARRWADSTSSLVSWNPYRV